MALTASQVYRDFVTDGIPSSGKNKALKAQIRALLKSYEDNIAALLGAAGFGSDIPGLLYTLTVTGGTANAIQATITPGIPGTRGDKLYLITPTANNTGAVTVYENGGITPIAIKDVFGSNLVADSLVEDVPQLMVWSNDHYRLFLPVDVDADAILADAQTAATSAATSAADAAAAGNSMYPTRTDAANATIPSGAEFILVAGYATKGDAPLAVYVKMAGAPGVTKAWHFQSDDGAWWQLAPNDRNEIFGEQLGMIGDWSSGTNGTNNDTALQALLECAEALSATARIGSGRFRYTTTIRFNYDGLRLYGSGSFNTWLIPATSGATIAGPSSGKVEECELFDFSLVSDATNGPAISLDLTRFTSSRARLTVQNKKANAVLVYMEGNGDGTGPYYNDFEFVLAGNTDQTQVGVQLESSGVGGADGANDNTIRVKRSVLLGTLFDVRAGNGNKFPASSAESVGLSYIQLNFRAADDTGTVTGGSENTLVDSGQSWTTSEWVGAAVKNNITGEVRLIANNNGTTLTLADTWGTQPTAGDDYSIYLGKAIGNMFGPIRGEGLDASNPNFITAHPGADLNVVTPNYLTSLGTGQHAFDNSGSPNNHWYNGGTQTFPFKITAPGAGANIDLTAKNVAAGGIYLPSYAFRCMTMRATTSSHASLLTATVFAGLSTIMAINLPNGAATGLVFPGPTQRGIRNGASSPIFLNFTSGAGGFTGDVEIILQVDLA